MAAREWHRERMRMTPKNVTVDDINSKMTDMFPGSSATLLLSADALGPADDPVVVTSEFLNSMNLAGIPPHRLALKVGMPVMLLRNVNPADGHCNGSRYIVTRISPRLLELSQPDMVQRAQFWWARPPRTT